MFNDLAKARTLNSAANDKKERQRPTVWHVQQLDEDLAGSDPSPSTQSATKRNSVHLELENIIIGFTLNDIFALSSSGSSCAWSVAACRYRSCEKLHISLALWTNHPSDIATCNPRMDPLVVLTLASFMVELESGCELAQVSPPSSSLLLLPESAQSIISATSVVLKVAPKKLAQIKYFLASTGSSRKCRVR